MRKGSEKPRVLFLVIYPENKAPAQRFRVEALLPVLDEAGISYTIRPFMSLKTWQVLYQPGALMKKALGILSGFWRRTKTVLFEARHYDYVFIPREAASIGPPVFEWLLARVLKKKIIYDFDDAIWIPKISEQNKLARGLKAFWKVPKICSWSHVVSCGNDYLCNYARQHTRARVVRVPTVVDTVGRYNRIKEFGDGPVVVGWTGSHSTLQYLDAVMPVLARLQEVLDFTFLVIADKRPDLPLRDWRFLPWNPRTEIEDLLQIDVGIMPLTFDPWSEGKCGFKLIQYMSLGIPAIASDVGVNNRIIDQDENGYLYTKEEELDLALRQLITDKELRISMGISARKKIVSEYSIVSVKDTFLSLFRG